MTSTIQLTIKGMSCRHCATAVERALNFERGVRSAKVDYETKTATIEKYEDITIEGLCRVVEEAGYRASEKSPLPEDDD